MLNSADEYGDTARLLSYGFSRFEQRVVARPGEVVAHVAAPDAREPVAAMVEREVAVVVPRGRTTTAVVLPAERLRAPVGPGDPVGTVVYLVNGRVVAQATVVAALGVRPASWWARMLHWLRSGGPRADATR